MRVSYGEDLASPTGPEPCGPMRENRAEALTGVRAGWVLSHENVFIRSANGLRPSEGNTGRIAIARSARAPRGLKTPCTHAGTSQGKPTLPVRSMIRGCWLPTAPNCYSSNVSLLPNTSIAGRMGSLSLKTDAELGTGPSNTCCHFVARIPRSLMSTNPE